VTTTLYTAGLPKWMRSSLGAWSFRVQKRHQDPQEAESKARRLLRTLQRVGITSLEDLKARLDTRAKLSEAAKSAASKEGAEESEVPAVEKPLSPEEETKQAAGLLEAIGLWDEARMVRDNFKEQMRRRQKRPLQRMKSDSSEPSQGFRRFLRRAVSDAMGQALQFTPPRRELKRFDSNASDVTIAWEPDISKTSSPDAQLSSLAVSDVNDSAMKEVPSVESEAVTNTASQSSDAPDIGSSAAETCNIDSEALDSKTPEGEEKPEDESKPEGEEKPDDKPAEKKEAEVKPKEHWAFRRHYLVSALLSLQQAASAEEVAASTCLRILSADEEALQLLAQRTKEHAPALAELRRLAVDRDVLLELEAKDTEPPESDGESCYSSFGLDDRSGDEGSQMKRPGQKAKPKQNNPLVLPPGWQTVRVRKGKRESTEVIAPDGTRYTQAQARSKVNADWRARNVSDALKTRFEERLKQRAVPAEVPAAPALSEPAEVSNSLTDLRAEHSPKPAAPKRRRLTRKTKP